MRAIVLDSGETIIRTFIHTKRGGNIVLQETIGGDVSFGFILPGVYALALGIGTICISIPSPLSRPALGMSRFSIPLNQAQPRNKRRDRAYPVPPDLQESH